MASKLEKIEGDLKKITPGKWEIERREVDCGYFRFIGYSGNDVFCCDESLDVKNAKHNAEFIASAPQTIHDLLELLKEAKEMAEFYASEKSYRTRNGGHSQNRNLKSPTGFDCGETAQQWLKELETFDKGE